MNIGPPRAERKGLTTELTRQLRERSMRFRASRSQRVRLRWRGGWMGVVSGGDLSARDR